SVWASLGARAGAGADPGGQPVRRPPRLCRIPKEISAPAAFAGGQDLHRHPPLERDGEGWPLRRARTTGGAGARNRRVLPPAALSQAQAAVSSSRRAAFSPIMIDGALVLPDVSVGMIEASATRRPKMPRTRRLSSTTAVASLPILQVPTGW